ncbi:MAG TPA: MFS transporter [Usitatibacteraceae bacterium]|nr:MFS transporter [Usitatibacteraceae bacterium]
MILDVRREERPALAWAFCYFFVLLCAYYVLRPVRDEMGIQGGVGNLPWLFTGTFVGMLLVTPLFGWITSRWPRRIFLPGVYLFFIANLLGFHAAMRSEAIPMAQVAPAFFIWLSVFNYFVVSVFWSFMTDVFDSAAAKRLFGAIAAGGSAGAMLGPLITAAIVKEVGIANLLLISAALLAVAIVCILGLGRWARGNRVDGPSASRDEQAIGGGVLDGIRLAFRSPYLLTVCGYVFLLQGLGTYFYLEQVRIMSETIADAAERTQLFAWFDLAVNSLTLIVQVLVTSTLLRRMGLVFCLVFLPALAVLSLAVTGLVPTLAVIAVSGILRRASEFAVGKPAREILFTVVERSERYKAKNFIDTVVARGSDVVSTWGHAGLRALGMGTSQMAFAMVPLSLFMIAAGVWLGRAQERRAAAAGAGPLRAQPGLT